MRNGKKQYHHGNESNSENEKRRREEKLQKRTKFLESLQLPRDVCLGAMRVTLTGNAEAWIENYRGLLEYTEQEILLQGKTCQVSFEGEHLSIDYYTNEDMKISGCIQYGRDL